MPIRFTHNGKEYIGELQKVQGAGETAVYHLIIDKYYKGRLRFSSSENKWVFDGEFAEVAERLGKYVESLPEK
jgi:hypothetical protein